MMLASGILGKGATVPRRQLDGNIGRVQEASLVFTKLLSDPLQQLIEGLNVQVI